MTLLHLFLAGGFLALIVLIAYTIKQKACAALGLSLTVIVAFVLLSIAVYQVQLGYDHMHMTRILLTTAEGLRAGKADAVLAAYDRFSAMRTNAGVTFWDARNQLYEDLAKLGATANGIQGAATNRSPAE
jgi:hypothetical protein